MTKKNASRFVGTTEDTNKGKMKSAVGRKAVADINKMLHSTPKKKKK